MRITKIVGFSLMLLSLGFTLGCAEEQHLGQVDIAAFKSDRGGCKNLRQKDIEKLEAAKDSLLGKSENEIIELLGRYDVQVLDRRQKKMFVYYLEKSKQCQDLESTGFGKTMILRFNAVSLVHEVNFQIGLP